MQAKSRSMIDRLDFYSNKFLGLPYQKNAQDEDQLFRFDAFDCVTYVNNVLALSFSNTQDEFLAHLLRLNYYDGVATFDKRFHFMSCDWNVENQKNQYVKDVTDVITNSLGETVYCTAKGDINKPAWFLKQNKPVPQQVSITPSVINYIPLSVLFSDDCLFSQIPHGSIVEIVRPNWDLTESIGTQLHVSHLGFVFRKENVLLFRHATSVAKLVVEVDFRDYLRDCLKSPTIKGINVQVVL